MPLQKQVIPIDLTRGLDNKTDPKLGIPGRLTTLENGQFQSADTISRRTGFAPLTNTVTDGTSMGTQLMEATLQDELLRVDTDRRLLSYSGLGWVARGYVPLNTVTAKPIIRNTATQSSFDCAYSSTYGVTVWAWQDSRGGVRVSAYDETGSGAFLFSDISLSSTGTAPRVILHNQSTAKFCVLYVEGANLRIRTITASALSSSSTWTAAVTIINNAENPGVFDASSQTALGIAIICKRTVDAGARLILADDLGAVISNVSLVDAAGVDVLALSNVHIHVLTFVPNEILVVYSGNAFGVRAQVGITGTPVNVVTLPVAIITDDIWHITSFGGAATTVYYETSSSSANHYIRSALVTNSAGTATLGATATLAFGNVGIASSPFYLGSGQDTISMAVVNDSSTQPTLFVLAVSGHFSGKVIAKALVWRCAGMLSTKRVPTANVVGTGAVFPSAERGRLSLQSGQNTTPIGVTRVGLTPYTASERVAVELNGNLLFASAAPSIYDGVAVTEHGFHLYPEPPAVAQVAGGGALVDGTYNSVIVYEWVDARGNLHKSIPSVATPCIISAGGGVARLTYDIQTLQLTSKTSPLSEVSLVIYRTARNGSIYYRASSLASPTLNVPANATVTVVDSTSDAALVGNQILYTNGHAELENAGCPPCRVATIHQGRLVVAGLDGYDNVAYSKEKTDGDGAGFNEVLTLALPADGGAITALASMDDKLIISKQDRWYYVSGEGPNAAGQQNGYSLPQLAAGETGCRLSCSRSLQVTDDGIWFQSSKGIRLLSRGLSVTRDAQGRFVGADVDSEVSGALVASILDRSKDQVRFYTGTNVLVWDEHWRQWSKFTNYGATDAVRWGSVLVHDAATAPQQSSAAFSDNGGNDKIQLTIETGWLALSGVQGLQRVYRLMILGTFYVTGSLSLEVGYDYADAYQTAVSLTTGVAQAVGTPLQIEYRLPIQKCEAIRFRIVEKGGGVANVGFSNFALLVGGKGGTFKLPATKITG